MSVTVLVAPSAAEVYGTKSRGLVGVALLGLVGGVLVALWTDRWALRRRRVAAESVLPAAEPPAAEPPVPEPELTSIH
jgi:hypothetical protein